MTIFYDVALLREDAIGADWQPAGAAVRASFETVPGVSLIYDALALALLKRP